MDKSNDNPNVIPAAPTNLCRAHELAPDAVPCPDWCTVGWHSNPRLWEPDYNDNGRGLSGRRTCIGVVSSVPMQREVGDPAHLEDIEPVRVSVERYQGFDLSELGKGYPVQWESLPGVRVVSIHADEDVLFPRSALALATAMLAAYQALASTPAEAAPAGQAAA